MALAGVALSGCGGGDEEAADPAAPRSATGTDRQPARPGKAPSRAEFGRRADAACADAKERAAPISAALDRKVADEDAIGVAAELRKALPIARRLLRRMRALTPPSGDEATFERYLAVVTRQTGRVPLLIEALEAEDISTIEVLAEELKEGNRSARRLARLNGFKACDPPGVPGR